ncbi:MAG TPA: PilZ domain-containing protein [Myxococcota bacterium]|nr:PilZ domain-containing protein [Myxococcota bacterium]
MNVSRRRWRRFNIVLCGDLTTPSRKVATETSDVCHGGALIRVGAETKPGTVLHLRLDVPDAGPLAATVRVRHVEDGLAGVEFIVVPVAHRRAFDAWLGAWAAENEPERRQAARKLRDLVVWASNDEGLQGFALRDVSRTGMFLHTTREFRIGHRVTTMLVDPATERTLRVTARVVRITSRGSLEERGVGVAFEGLTLSDERVLLDFLS